jgi:hypothetical protein
VPNIFVNQDPHPAEPRGVEGLDPFTSGEVALLVEQPVGGQVDLAVHVHDLPAFAVKRGVVEAVPRRFLDETGHHRHRAGGLEQLLDFGGRRGDRQIGHHVADEITGQRQLRKHDQVGLLLPRRRDLLQVQGQVPLRIAQHGRDLSHRHAVHVPRRPAGPPGRRFRTSVGCCHE